MIAFKNLTINAVFAHQMKTEIARLDRLKLENLQKVLDAARTDLEYWWSTCFVGELERFKFKPYYDGTYVRARCSYRLPSAGDVISSTLDACKITKCILAARKCFFFLLTVL